MDETGTTSNVRKDGVVLSQVKPNTPCGLHLCANVVDISPSKFEPVITMEMLP